MPRKVKFSCKKNWERKRQTKVSQVSNIYAFAIIIMKYTFVYVVSIKSGENQSAIFTILL